MSAIIDADVILSESEHWRKLEKEWGIPIDLEIDTEEDFPKLKPVLSTMELNTFDSSFLLKKIRRKVGRQLSKRSNTSALDYVDFISDLKKDPSKESSKQFFVINGQVVSASSVEKICEEIDNVFRSIEKLASATSTLRKKSKKIPEIVECSITTSGLSFDDTRTNSNNPESYDAVLEQNIEDALKQFNETISGIEGVDTSTFDSVTTLVRKFSSVLKNTSNCKCSPKRQKRQQQCCDKFQDLVDFWKNRAFESN